MNVTRSGEPVPVNPSPLGDAPTTAEASSPLLLQVGRNAPIPLQFIELSGEYFALPSQPGSHWMSQALRAGSVQVTLPDGRVRTCIPRGVTDPVEKNAVRDAMRRKVGTAAWARYYGPGGTAGEIPPPLGLRPSSSKGDLSRVDRVRGEFDTVSSSYTSINSNDPLARYLKGRSAERLARCFHLKDPLLELGPGTGLETLPLLQEGHTISAVDISPRMLSELQERVARVRAPGKLTTIEGDIVRLEEVLRDVPTGAFRGAYSTFGALNLIPDLTPVAKALERVLSPGSSLYLALLNRWAIPPLLYQVMEGHWREARWSLRTPIPAEGSYFPLDLYPWSPTQVERAFSPEFTLREREAASAIMPPRHAPRLYSWFRPEGRQTLCHWDSRLARHWPFDAFSQWMFYRFERS